MNREPEFFGAPWGLLLRAMTMLSVLLLGGMVAVGIAQRPSGHLVWTGVMILLPLVMLVTSVFFMIRGYLLYPDELFIKRLGWFTKVPLDGLISARFDPGAMKRVIRRFGNGGMFCFAGFYKSKELGPFRAFVTDWRRAVVLRFPDRTIVITPEDPEAFVGRISAVRRLKQSADKQ